MSRSGDVSPYARKRGAVAMAALTVVLSMAAPVHAACVGDCNTDGTVTVDDLLAMVNIALGAANVSTCLPGDADNNKTITINEILAAVNNALAGCPAPPTTTPAAATATATPTVAPTYGVLGVRHFVINPAKSPFQARLSSALNFSLGKFEGQSNGQTEPAFLDLKAGQPDANGVATIDVVGASDFIYADARATVPLVLCLKPLVPVLSAGIVACNGGYPLGFTTTQDHNVGQVGINGFTAAQCQAMNGHLESPNQICAAGGIGLVCSANADCDSSAGSGDGVCGIGQATCTAGMVGATCQNGADCDTGKNTGDGVCGPTEPEPGVCNGQLTAGIYPGDSGPGAVILAPDSQFFHIVGLPVRLSMQSSLPCVDPGPGADITFALTTGVSQGTILDFNNTPDQQLTSKTQGVDFSCADWQDPAAPGRFVLTVPALNQNAGSGDVITTFTFDGSPIPTPSGM